MLKTPCRKPQEPGFELQTLTPPWLTADCKPPPSRLSRSGFCLCSVCPSSPARGASHPLKVAFGGPQEQAMHALGWMEPQSWLR